MGVGFFEGGGDVSRSWPLRSVWQGVAPIGLAQARELSLFFPSELLLTSALIIETRRQIAGCLATVQSGLVLALGGEDLTELKDLSWRMLNARPDLMPVSLLVHMRARAALVLIGEGQTRTLPQDTDLQSEEIRIALRIALARWRESIDPNAPIPADLPAEPFMALVWLSAAFLTDALEARAGMSQTRAALALSNAADALFANHDEDMGPIAIARRLAARHSGSASQTLQEGDPILFLALLARKNGIDLDRLLSGLTEWEADIWLALCRISSCEWPVVAGFLETLSRVRSDIDAELLPVLAASFEMLSTDDAESRLLPIRIAPPLATLIRQFNGESA